jgi:hypothetical protein
MQKWCSFGRYTSISFYNQKIGVIVIVFLTNDARKLLGNRDRSEGTRVKNLPVCRAFGVLVLLSMGCQKTDVCLLNQVKRIPVTGKNDVVYIERSQFWDGAGIKARSGSNRQTFIFVPPPNMTLFVTLENMGGVPLKRDTFKTKSFRFAETYLRTSTKDTNLAIHIETSDKTKRPTDVTLYMRDVDSVCSDIRFEGVK